MTGESDWREWVEERLLRVEHLVTSGQMAAEAAHQINNSLEGIKNYLYLLRQDIPQLQDSEEMGIVEQEVQRIADMSRQLTSFQRSSGVGVRHAATVREVLDRVLMLLSSRLRRHGIGVEWGQFDDGYATAAGPELTQIFFSLLCNAVESMPRGGRIHLAGRRESGGLTVVMRDEGTGIAADELDRVFEPFYTRKPEALGLGLAVCRMLADRIGAGLELKSQPGVGTAVAVHVTSEFREREATRESDSETVPR